MAVTGTLLVHSWARLGFFPGGSTTKIASAPKVPAPPGADVCPEHCTLRGLPLKGSVTERFVTLLYRSLTLNLLFDTLRVAAIKRVGILAVADSEMSQLQVRRWSVKMDDECFFGKSSVASVAWHCRAQPRPWLPWVTLNPLKLSVSILLNL